MDFDINFLTRLADVAITLALMAYFLRDLYRRNQKLEDKNTDLIEKMHFKDLENIKTLEAISKMLDNLERNGHEKVRDIKTHITERTAEIKDELRRYGGKA